MSNEVTNYTGKVSLLDMRADSKQFPRLHSIPREQAIAGMVKIVTQAFLYRGQASDPSNIQFIASTLLDELLEDDKYGARNISLGEIQVVVKRAVLGGSEMFGISIASLYKVIMDYVKTEGHLIEREIQERKRKDSDNALRNAAALNTMLQAYTGEYIANHKQ